MKNAKQIFEKLYDHVSGSEASHKDRAQLEKDEFGLVYGEILFDSFAEILSVVQPLKDEVFYDLGCGAGKAVFCSALLYEWKKCIGIELLPSLYELCQKQLENFKNLVEVKEFFPQKFFPIQFININFLEYDFSDANIIFINATSFNENFWNAITLKLNQLNTGTRIILTTKKLEESHFQLLDARMRLMTWGMNSVNIYQKK